MKYFLEKENGTPRNKLVKSCKETGLSCSKQKYMRMISQPTRDFGCPACLRGFHSDPLHFDNSVNCNCWICKCLLGCSKVRFRNILGEKERFTGWLRLIDYIYPHTRTLGCWHKYAMSNAHNKTNCCLLTKTFSIIVVTLSCSSAHSEKSFYSAILKSAVSESTRSITSSHHGGPV